MRLEIISLGGPNFVRRLKNDEKLEKNIFYGRFSKLFCNKALGRRVLPAGTRLTVYCWI